MEDDVDESCRLVDCWKLPQSVALLSSRTERVVREKEAMKRQKPGNIQSRKLYYTGARTFSTGFLFIAMDIKKYTTHMIV